jgi:hypothetical protein
VTCLIEKLQIREVLERHFNMADDRKSFMLRECDKAMSDIEMPDSTDPSHKPTKLQLQPLIRPLSHLPDRPPASAFSCLALLLASSSNGDVSLLRFPIESS